MPNIAQFDPFKVQNISVLKKPNAKEALELLESIANQVQPILRRRKWKVPQLSEFFPRSNNLLGLNIGGGGGNTQEIKIRLRRPHDECSFYDHHHVMGTMLHEMAHNIHSPHNDEFFKLWDELWEEVEDLMDKGISGSGVGFDAPPVGRLGGRGPVPVHNPDPRKLRDVAVKAARERAKKQALMPRGAQRLGGAAASGLTPAQAAARAAERRAQSDRCCPSGAHGPQNVVYDDATGEVRIADGAAAQPDSPSRQRRLPLQPQSRAGPSFDPGAAPSGDSGDSCGMDIDGAAAVIDLTQDDDDTDTDDGHVRDAPPLRGGAARSGHAGAPGSSSPAGHNRGVRVSSAGVPHGCGGSSGGSWACEACTLVNSSRVGQCAACGSAAPGAAGSPGSGRAATPIKFHMGLGGSGGNGSGSGSGGNGSSRQRGSSSGSPKRDASRASGGGAGGRSAGSPIRMGLGGGLAGSRQGGSGGGRGVVDGISGGALGGRLGCWSCRFCTLANPEAEANCGACGEWRFTTGLPSASRPTVEQKM